MFPRSKERGPIEARSMNLYISVYTLFPRSKERGPIEAQPARLIAALIVIVSSFERTRPH